MKEESRVLELYATIYSIYRMQRRPLVVLRKQWDMSMKSHQGYHLWKEVMLDEIPLGHGYELGRLANPHSPPMS